MLHERSALPIDDALPAICAALEASCNLVVVAPPGAGKTTRAPLALLDADWAKGGKLILLEPRRLAARAAASRMAATFGETVGETIGLRMRLEFENLGANARRGRHRGRVRADDPRRCGARGRGGRSVR